MINRKILLDTETTGFYPKNGDKVIEIACLEIFDDKSIGESFHYYLNPNRDIPYDSIKVHGITNEKVKDCPIFADIAQDFLDFIADSKIIAHNANFDMDFINHELQLVGLLALDSSRFIDTLAIARKKFNSNRGNSLDDLCKKFNISLNARKDFHGAMIDIELLSQVYINLIAGQNNIFNNEDEEKKTLAQQSFDSIAYGVKNFPIREFKLSNNEIENHNNFIKNFKNTLWNN
jgi:DNA polymerase-3 subunit epsilon